MAVIPPRDLNAAASVSDTDVLIVDKGSSVEKALPSQIVDAAIPLASQAEAEAGADNTKRVTPLRVKQAIDAIGVSADSLAAGLAPKANTADLASTADDEGAGLTAFSQEASYDADRAGKKLQQLRNPLDHPWLAAGNGTTDDRAAIASAIANGPIIITGNHRIASNITINKAVQFIGDGRLTIDSGATVTFSGAVTAPDRQVFFGTGAVAGLDYVNVAWFAGDVASGTSALTEIQKAMNACNTGADVHWGKAYYSNGSAYIELTKAQNVQSPGRTRGKLIWTTSACLGFLATTTEGAKISNIGFDLSSPATIPASGVAARMGAPNCTVSGCYSVHCFIGTFWESTNGGKDIDNNFNGATFSANYISASANIQITGASGSAFTDWVDLSTTTGFIPGESVTFSGGGTGTYVYGASGTRCKMALNNVPPTAGQTATGGTSGTVATITAITYGHQGGGFLIEGNSPGCNIVENAWAGGLYPGHLNAATDAHGSRPEYCSVIGNYFDFGVNAGMLISKCAGFDIVGNWFSSRSSDGLYITTAIETSITANRIYHSWGNGIVLLSTSKGTIITNNKISGNNRSNNGKAGVYVVSGTTDFIIQGNVIGKGTAAGFDGTQARPVIVEVGASDRYVIKNNLVSNNTNNAIQDGGTGVNKAVGENF